MLRRWSGVGLAAVIAASFTVVLPESVRAAGEAVGSVTKYTDPTIATPRAITSGPDGALWFANTDNNSIGRISTTGAITNYTDPTMLNPSGIASGADGALWFTNTGNNSIGRITTIGTVTNYPLPPLTGPSAITSGPDGALWFTNIWANWIGRISTSGVINSYVDASIVNAYGITVGPDGALWFTNAGAGNASIGRITTGGDITTFTDPTMFNPYGIASGPDGALWFTNAGNNSIGRITTTGTVTNFTDPTFSNLHGIVSGPDGALWFGNTGNDSIGRITTTGTVTNYTGPTILYPAAITAGPDGALWFTDLGNSIGRITTGTSWSPSTYVAMGDSFSSGEGNPPFDAGTALKPTKNTDKCHRSPAAWPRLIGATPNLHVACSGAVIDDLLYGSGYVAPDDRSQYSRLIAAQASASVSLVTITIGGNDLGFPDILATCFTNNCTPQLNAAPGYLPALRRRLASVYETIREDAPNAQIIVIGYPRLFPLGRAVNCGWLSNAEKTGATALAADLDTAIAGAVADANVAGANATYVSVLDVLAGHELCTPDSWVYRISAASQHTTNYQYQGHPTTNGQHAIADRVNAAL